MEKSNLIGRIVLVIIVLVLGGGFLLFIRGGKVNSSLCDEGPFSEIIFPELLAAIDENLSIVDNLKAETLKNKNILNSYYTVKEKISEERRLAILKAFSMNDDNMESKELCVDISISTYKKGNEELVIYGNGTYEYRKDTSTMMEDKSNDEIRMDKDECYRRAEDFLKAKDLLPEVFAPGAIGDTIEEYASSNVQKVVSKDVIFYRKINGIDVEGSSKIIVTLNKLGAIESVYSSYREMDKEVKVHNILSIEEAVQKIKDRDGQVYINEETDEITLDEIEVVYYEDASSVSDNITIQPIYRVKGKCLKGKKVIDEYLGLTHAMKPQ